MCHNRVCYQKCFLMFVWSNRTSFSWLGCTSLLGTILLSLPCSLINKNITISIICVINPAKNERKNIYLCLHQYSFSSPLQGVFGGLAQNINTHTNFKFILVLYYARIVLERHTKSPPPSQESLGSRGEGIFCV